MDGVGWGSVAGTARDASLCLDTSEVRRGCAVGTRRGRSSAHLRSDGATVGRPAERARFSIDRSRGVCSCVVPVERSGLSVSCGGASVGVSPSEWIDGRLGAHLHPCITGHSRYETWRRRSPNKAGLKVGGGSSTRPLGQGSRGICVCLATLSRGLLNFRKAPECGSVSG